MRRRTLFALFTMLICVSPAWAQEKEDSDEKPKADPVAEKLKKIAELGPGVRGLKSDKKGRIQSCVVVGSSRISTALGKAKGLEEARKRASISAQAEFVKWLKTDVSVHQTSRDETTLFLEGSESNDEDALRESGKAIEKTETKIELAAKGLVRGLQVIHQEINAEDKSLTVVYGWKASTAKATRGIEDDEAAGTKGAKGASKAGKPKEDAEEKSGRSTDKTIKDKSTTSDDAGDFLPK